MALNPTAPRQLPYPFLRVVGRAEEPTDWMAIWAPMLLPEWYTQYKRFSEKYRFVAFTSYMDFPRMLESPKNPGNVGLAEAWAHCFRNPGAYFPPSVPSAFLPQSDFTSPSDVRIERLVDQPRLDEEFDVVFVCLERWRGREWKRDVKGWSRALRCIERLHTDLGLRTLIVGPQEDALTRSIPGARVIQQLKWFELLARIRDSRMLLVASAWDASPRVISEALCLDRPVLVHKRILGGWHYVNPTSGAFFDDEDDVVEAARHCLSIKKGPRDYYMTHHGPVVAGLRLKKLLAPLDPSLSKHNLLRITLNASPGEDIL